MSFSSENERWILDKIQEAIHPKGWKKVAYLLRSWGLLAIMITAFVALIAIAVALANTAFSRVEENAKFRQRTDDHFTAVEIRFGAIETQLVSLRALIASSAPTVPRNQAAAKELLAQAYQKSIPALPESVVQQSGNSFIEASAKDHKAWNVALEFVSYRSSLNKMDPSTLGEIEELPLGYAWLYDVPVVNGKRHQSDIVHKYVPIEQAARFEKIGKPGKRYPENSKVGPITVLIVGGATSIDSHYLRHVIFSSVEVHYSGKPTILEDVMFLNCTFVMDDTPSSRDLGEKVLADIHVDFTSKG
jgi:hypothetical protein